MCLDNFKRKESIDFLIALTIPMFIVPLSTYLIKDINKLVGFITFCYIIFFPIVHKHVKKINYLQASDVYSYSLDRFIDHTKINPNVFILTLNLKELFSDLTKETRENIYNNSDFIKLLALYNSTIVFIEDEHTVKTKSILIEFNKQLFEVIKFEKENQPKILEKKVNTKNKYKQINKIEERDIIKEKSMFAEKELYALKNK